MRTFLSPAKWAKHANQYADFHFCTLAGNMRRGEVMDDRYGQLALDKLPEARVSSLNSAKDYIERRYIKSARENNLGMGYKLPEHGTSGSFKDPEFKYIRVNGSVQELYIDVKEAFEANRSGSFDRCY